ncbi:MAG: hypothetical protein K8H86_09815 [Ignavibacteriaceae bacterium]|nr:hypothetical protein [Ignavibacteriaceae bacterium]
MKKYVFFFFLLVAYSINAQSIKESLDDYINSIDKPKTVSEFETAFHLSPVNQDTTSSCWSFATLSFIETEMDRLHGKSVKLAMMFPVYYGFIEKIKLFASTKGKSRFSPGDLFTGVLDVINKYGIVPLSAYGGDARGCGTFNHSELYEELYSLTKKIKSNDPQDSDKAVDEAIAILNKHLGVPPSEFEFEGKQYTPITFRDEVVNLPLNDYVMVTSFSYAPFYKKIKLNVPDNWRDNSNYLNLPLNEFLICLSSAIDNGFTAAIDADISEPAYNLNKKYLVIPPFDIEYKSINQVSRQFRFDNGSTTDDHLMHIIGHKKIAGNDWFLLKDSWRNAYETDLPNGYIFMNADYFNLKVLAIILHNDALKEIEEKIKI